MFSKRSKDQSQELAGQAAWNEIQRVLKDSLVEQLASAPEFLLTVQEADELADQLADDLMALDPRITAPQKGN